MKVNIGPYKDWLGPYQIAEKILFWKDKYEDDIVHDFGTWLAKNKQGEDSWLMKVCQWVDSKKKRKINVQIDPWDSWDAGNTIALIALPILKQLQKTKHGAPYTADEDVPEAIRSTSAKPKENEWDTDEFHFDRWEFILSEIIWALEQIVEDKEGDFFHWDKTQETEKGSIGAALGLGKCTIDHEGLNAYNARITRGTTLLGKYLRSCWD